MSIAEWVILAVWSIITLVLLAGLISAQHEWDETRRWGKEDDNS